MGTKPSKHSRDPFEAAAASPGQDTGGQAVPRPGSSSADLSQESDTERYLLDTSKSSEGKLLHEMSTGPSSAQGGRSDSSLKQQELEPSVYSAKSPMLSEQRELQPLTPLIINDTSPGTPILKGKPYATSTPSTNGQLGSFPLSPDSGTDQSDDETFSPSEQQDGVESRRSEPNFGRFYNMSYLGMGKSSRNKAVFQQQQQQQQDKNKVASSSHFHRPPNFSYSKDPPPFLKKKASGMAALATGQRRIVKVTRSSSPAELRKQEPIRMSMFPDAKPKLPNEPDKIERDDWPAPASPAAILPEILRQRRRSRGEKDDDDEDEKVQEDPKIKRELEEISKIKDESGIGKVIYQELDKLKARPHQPLDPWKASRSPSAKFEPRYRTRFQSPMFASPSRFLDRPRYAWDDSDIRTYRSASTLANLPTPKPGYGPSYIAPRAATLPLAGAYGARDFRFFDFGEEDRHERVHTSSSTLTGDTSSRRHDSSYSGYDPPSISLLQLQKSTWHTQIEPTIYPYEKLKITNFDLPKDVDTNQLEIHLSTQEFESLFNTNREHFYKLAEWKRNDIKRKLDLY